MISRIAMVSVWLLLADASLPSMAEGAKTPVPLPPLDIFGFTPEAQEEFAKQPYDIASLTRELEKAAKPMDPNQRAGEEPSATGIYCTACIPAVLTCLTPLYGQSAWTVEQRGFIEKSAATVAIIASQPDLAIPVTDDVSASACLSALSRWFRTYSNKNENLARLLFPLVLGPFHGNPVRADDLVKMKRVATQNIPGHAANFAVWRDTISRGKEPVVIGVVGHDRKLRWARRFSGENEGSALGLGLAGRPKFYPDYGFVIEGTIRFESRTEKADIYLDQNLNLRFYRMTWSY